LINDYCNSVANVFSRAVLVSSDVVMFWQPEVWQVCVYVDAPGAKKKG